MYIYIIYPLAEFFIFFNYNTIQLDDSSLAKLTYAEMTADHKNSISHRGRALEKLIEFLKEKGEELAKK